MRVSGCEPLEGWTWVETERMSIASNRLCSLTITVVYYASPHHSNPTTVRTRIYGRKNVGVAFFGKVWLSFILFLF